MAKKETKEISVREATENRLKERLAPAIQDQVQRLIEHEFENVFAAYKKQLQNFLEESPNGDISKFSFGFSVAVKLKAKGGTELGVVSRLGYGIRRKVETGERLVHSDPELPLHTEVSREDAA